MNPEKRNYPVAQMPTTEAAIDYNMMRDVYVVIGDPQADGGWAVRTYIKPMANWIWLGSALMALGGLISHRSALPRCGGCAKTNHYRRGARRMKHSSDPVIDDRVARACGAT